VVLESQHYLYRLRAACILDPARNRHHLAALDRILAIAKRVATIEDFLEQTNQLAALVEANQLDRNANLHAIALSHDAPWLTANSRAIEIPATIHRLFSSLFHLRTFPLDPAALEADIHQSFRQLRSLDPHFEPRGWHQLPRYRLRLPWDASLLSDWLEPLWGQYPNTAPAFPTNDLPPPGNPTPFSGPWPDAAPIEVKIVEPTLRDQRLWPDRILHAHDLETIELLHAAATPISLEAISVERALSRSILACHNRLRLATLLAPFRAAIAGFPIQPALSITGLSADQLLAHPRVRFFFEHNLKPNLATNLDGFGAEEGEAGFDLLLLAQAQPGFDFSRCLATES
jgi:hypothetical protein